LFLRAGIEVRVDCAAVMVNADGARLEKIVHNLVSNSHRHGKQPVEIVGRITASDYRLAVIDSGGGLDEIRAADPFAPFVHAPQEITTANSLGLGLSVADRSPGWSGTGSSMSVRMVALSLR
ncbi:MAG: ATP-binding protein, partial [Acidimicrobiia bacterium]